MLTVKITHFLLIDVNGSGHFATSCLQSNNVQQPFKIKSNLLVSCHQSMGVRK